MKCAWCGFERGEQVMGPCPRCQFVPPGQEAQGYQAPPSAFEPTARHAPFGQGPALDSTAAFDAPVAGGGYPPTPGYSAGPGYAGPGYSAPGQAPQGPAASGFPGGDYGGYPAPGTPPPAGQSVREQLIAAQRKLPAHLPDIPLELLAVCGVMALSGLLLLWPGLSLLSDGFPLLGDGSFGLAIGLIGIDLGAVILALAAALGLLAWRLSHGDRVARGLSYVLLGAIVFAVLIGGSHPAGLIIVLLLSIASLVILAAAPNVRQFFTGSAAPEGGQPVSVIIARTLLTWFAAAAIFLGLTFLPMGIISVQRVFAGVIFLVVGIGVFMVSSRLARGEPMARFIATALMAVYALLGLVGGGRDTATLLEFGIAAGIVCLLWLPQDARAFFAQPPAAPGYGGQPYAGPGQPYDGQSYAGQPDDGGQSYGGPGNEAASYGAPGSYGAGSYGAGYGQSVPGNGFGGPGNYPGA